MVDKLRRIGESIYSVQNSDRIHGINKIKNSENRGQTNQRKKKNQDRKNTDHGRIDAIA